MCKPREDEKMQFSLFPLLGFRTAPSPLPPPPKKKKKGKTTHTLLGGGSWGVRVGGGDDGVLQTNKKVKEQKLVSIGWGGATWGGGVGGKKDFQFTCCF